MPTKKKYEVDVYLLAVRQTGHSFEVGLLMNKKGLLHIPKANINESVLKTVTELTHNNLLEIKEHNTDGFLQNQLLRIVDIYDVNMQIGIIYRLDFHYPVRKQSDLKFFSPTTILEMIESQQDDNKKQSFTDEHQINIIKTSLFNERRIAPNGYPEQPTI